VLPPKRQESTLDRSLHSPNHLLASLSTADFDSVRPHLRTEQLRHEAVLYDVGDEIGCAYFPHVGVISLVVKLASGETIETGMIGRDGLLGGSAVLNGKISLNKAIVQIAGNASVLDCHHLKTLADTSVAFRTTLNRYEQLILIQAQQSAACNITHTLEARLARWLLRCRDLMDSNDLSLTQEFIGQMLGVRRSSVSITSGTLQTAGLIRYNRGKIRILDLEGLRDAACECYATVKSQSDRLLGAI
jgi:CRP-like cAMP-binding protein